MKRNYEESVAVLLPVLDDDYVLMLTVTAIAPHVDEIWIHDDGSGQATIDTLDYLRQRFSNIRVQGTAGTRGVVPSINSLLASCPARHVILLDADCVLLETKASTLREIIEGSCPYVRLGFIECWGDLWHSRHAPGIVLYDQPCYVDRRKTDYTLRLLGGPEYFNAAEASRESEKWPGALLLHMTGARGDARLALRSMRRSYHQAGCPSDIHAWEKFGRLNAAALHARALKFLFRDALSDGRLYDLPQDLLPSLCRQHDRFEIVFDSSGKPCDRIDRGWSLPV